MKNELLSVGEVAALLRDMTDAEGIAFLCAMFDVRGDSGDFPPSECCAVARLAQKLTGNEKVSAGFSALVDPNNNAELEVGYHMKRFTEAFDEGEWPEIDTPPHDSAVTP